MKKIKVFENIGKQHAIGVVTIILVCLLFAFRIPTPQELAESHALKYLGSSLIQSFAALIAIPFAFYASYLHSKYGYTGLQFAVNRVKEYVFSLFTIVIILSILLIMFPNYPDIPNFEVNPDNFLRMLLFAEFFASAILLLTIYYHLIEVMTVTPSKLVDKAVMLTKIQKEISNGVAQNFEKLAETYQRTFELLRISLRDPTLHSEAEIILQRTIDAINKYPNFIGDYKKRTKVSPRATCRYKH